MDAKKAATIVRKAKSRKENSELDQILEEIKERAKARYTWLYRRTCNLQSIAVELVKRKFSVAVTDSGDDGCAPGIRISWDKNPDGTEAREWSDHEPDSEME